MNQEAPKGGVTVTKRLAMYQSNRKDWEHSPLAKELHRWTGILNKEWSLGLPSNPTLFFIPMRNAYATYGYQRGPIGTPDNITLNTAALDRPSAHIIRTLGHELLHLWQQYHGKPSPQRNYHNDEYVTKAAECGILIDKHGCTAGHTEAFSDLIKKHGIRLPNAVEVETGVLVGATGGIETKLYGTRGASGGGSRLKRWTCGCTIVRCSVNLIAQCSKCGCAFTQEG